MAESKRSRKYSNLKENKQRPLFLTKKEDATDVEAPKILLKPKEKPSVPPSPSISIATRDAATSSSAAASAASAGTITAGKSIATSTAPTSSSTSLTTPPSSSASAPASGASNTSAKPSNNAITAATGTALPSASHTQTPTTGSNASQSRDLYTPNTTPASHSDASPMMGAVAAEKIPKMTTALPLINDHFQIETASLQFLQDASAHFFVVGVIGTQGSGKSTLLNMLLSVDETNKTPVHEHFIHCHNGAFATKRTAAQHLSAAPTTEGVNIYITGDRLILLDCAPLLCNPYRKDAALSETDDLKLVAFMLSVCQTVLVVDSGAVNLELLRLLQLAELMKPSLDLAAAALTTAVASSTSAAAAATSASASNNNNTIAATSSSAASTASSNAMASASTATTSSAHAASNGKILEQLVVDRAHFPTVLIVHNMADQWHLSPAQAHHVPALFRHFFGESNLRLYAGNVRAKDARALHARTTTATTPSNGKRLRPQVALNFFAMPRSPPAGKAAQFTGHRYDMATVVQQFRQRVLMTPRISFAGDGMASGAFSEQNWGQLVKTVWDGLRNSYFMRKFESDLVARSSA